jgi:hypothetical protein
MLKMFKLKYPNFSVSSCTRFEEMYVKLPEINKYGGPKGPISRFF